MQMYIFRQLAIFARATRYGKFLAAIWSAGGVPRVTKSLRCTFANLMQIGRKEIEHVGDAHKR